MDIQRSSLESTKIIKLDPVVAPIADYEDLCTCFKLLHKGSRGEPACESKFSAFHLLPSFRGWIAYQSGEVEAAAGVVLDSEFGLPFRARFETEYRALKEVGHDLAEITPIVLEGGRERAFYSIMGTLLRYVFESEVDQLCVEVSMPEVTFWQRLFRFQVLARTRPTNNLGNHTRVLLTFDVKAWRDGKKPLSPTLRRMLQSSELTYLRPPFGLRLSWLQAARLLTHAPEALSQIGAGQLKRFRALFSEPFRDMEISAI